MVEVRYPYMRIFDLEIRPHDILWFSSFDVSGFTTTEPVVHNYALSYALSRFNRVLSNSNGPGYDEDLSNMTWYSNPARPILYQRQTITWNAIDDKTNTTEDPKLGKKNTPKMGIKSVLMPYPQTYFLVTAFSLYGENPPRIIRLGKKRTPCQIKIIKEWDISEIREYEVFNPSHIVNPIDVIGDIKSYRIVAIPPSLLSDDVTIERTIGIRKKDQSIIIPKHLIV